MESGRAWDFVAISAFVLSIFTAGGYFSLMYLGGSQVGGVDALGVVYLPITVLYSVWALWRSVLRRDLRGGWLAWIACGLLFLAAADFSRKLIG